MEVTVCQRVNEFIDFKQLSVNSLSKAINVAQTTLNSQLRGNASLSIIVVERILSTYPEVSAEWLLRGKGDMLLSEEHEEKEETPVVEDYWKAKYEAVKECYDLLVGSMTQATAKRNVG